MPCKSAITWTHEEIKLLEKMFEEGFSVSEMRQVLTRRREGSIRGKLKNIGLSLEERDRGRKVDIDFEMYEQISKLRKPI